MSRPVDPCNFSHAEVYSGSFGPPDCSTMPTGGTFMEMASRQWSTPQPHFKPGYTGHTPGMVLDSLGTTYGRRTHGLLCDHEVAGGRLCRIPGDTHPVPQTGTHTRLDVPANPHSVPEPHFPPGYTGFVPGSGVRGSGSFGESYGRATHVLLSRHFLGGGRLRPVDRYPPEYVAEEEDVKFYCYEHELTRDDLRRRSGQVPGYAGHMPRAAFRHGKSGTKIAAESVAEFQKIINK